MAFNKDLDKTLQKWAIEGENGRVLEVSVCQYNGGEAKLQIGPRTYDKKDGSKGYGKAGRLTPAEVVALSKIMPAISERIAIAMG